MVSVGRIICWNVAGVFSKNREFWTFVLSHDIIILLETWIERKSERSFMARLSTKFEWITLPATRSHMKGRAKGGQLVGIRKEGGVVWRFAVWKYGIIIYIKHLDKRPDDIIVSAYCCKGLNTLGEELANVLDEATRTGAQFLLIGDFNARIGLENVTTDEEDAITRKSEDEVLNFEGKKLLTFCDNNALKILNGCCRGDYTGKFTFIGALGASVIDYAIVKEDNPDMSLDVLARTESDHLPLVVTLDWSFVLQPNSVSIPRERWCWDKTVNVAFSRDLDRELQRFIVNDSVDLSTLVRIQSAAKTAGVKRSSTRKVGVHWFDRECKEEKRKVRRCLYKFRRSREEVDRLVYIAARKALRLLYYKKKKEREDDTWNRIRNCKNTTDFWRVVNNYRKGKNRKGQDIALDAWKQHFKILLNGTDSMSDDVNPHQEIDDLLFNSVDILDREFDEQELNKAINKLKGGKSPGIDMVINEFYKAMSRSARSIVLKTLNVIWRTQTCPREWRIGVIIPIYKAGEEADTNNYRGITLLNTLYKIMTTMMTARIQEWAEQEGIITENQAGFRKGYGTRDNLFTLNTLINSRNRKRGGKLFACFIDFKAAFDKISIGRLFEKLWQMGVRGRMFAMLKSIYGRTGNIVMTGLGSSDIFWTTEGVRQGCPLSPVLFSLYINDLEENWTKRNIGGAVMGKSKIFALKFADDIVTFAVDREGLTEMLLDLERYTQKNSLVLNVQKSKIMIFRRGGRRAAAEHWSFVGQPIEVVNKYKYLGFWFSTKNAFRHHLTTTRGKAQKIVNASWSIIRRSVMQTMKHKISLFQSLLLPVLMYGVEIWGNRRREEIEIVNGKFMKMILGLNFNTPDYLWAMELGRNDLECVAMKRVFKYVLHILKIDEKRWPLICLKEMMNPNCNPKFI
uniref:Reverse transcriptase domain-containing protein n=1 Tax=Strigamia maritima TaxID=126957 RepID=T1IQ89_STRMM